MIPVLETDTKIQTNITGMEGGQFSIETEAMAHVMSVLSGLYSDNILACVREYNTNAYDAQVDAGMVLDVNWKPVEVQTPNVFSSEFSVRDYGVGLDKAGMFDTYSKYGKSTKTNSDAVVGMLGMGSKAALTYTNSFTITGWKNGIRTTAIISKENGGVPVFDILEETPSDEPNGVKVSIPVGSYDKNAFKVKAKEFLSRYPHGTFILDGEVLGYKPEDVVIELEDGIKVLSTPGEINYWTSESFVMGGVAYPTILDGRNSALDIHVPIGTFTFSPSRESIKDNERNRAALEKITADVFERVVETVQERLDAIDDPKEAVEFYDAQTRWMRNELDRTWRGHRLPTTGYINVATCAKINYEYYGDDKEWRAENTSGHASVPINQKVFVVENCNISRIVRDKKVRLAKKAEEEGVTRVLLVEGTVDSPFLTDIVKMDWKDVNNISLDGFDIPKKTFAAKTVSNTYFRTLVNGSYKDKLVTEFDANFPVYYLSNAELKHDHYYNMGHQELVEYTNELLKDKTIVILEKNRWEKFTREYVPSAQHFSKLLEEFVTDFQSDYNGKDVYVGVPNWSEGFVELLKDIEYNEFADLRNQAIAYSKNKDYIDRQEMISQFNRFTKLKFSEVSKANIVDVSDKYSEINLKTEILIKKRFPLLLDLFNSVWYAYRSNLSASELNLKHANIYINAVLEEE